VTDQTTTSRRVLPNGRPAPDAAPDSALLDHDDLAKVYQALRSGHSVGLGADGNVHVHDEVGTPIDATSQAFVEGKLAEVKDMLRMGFAVEIHADGTINANTPGSGIVYRSDPRAELGDDDRAMIRAALKDGEVVGIRPDGTLEVMQPDNPQPRPYADDVDRIMTELDHQISSGTLADHAKSGSGLVISANPNGDTAFEYKDLPKPTLPAVAFPAEIRDPHDPTTVDALHSQAAELQQRAATLREASNQPGNQPGNQQADAAAAAAAALENRAQAMTDAAGHLAEANRLEAEAAKARADGDGDGAQQHQDAADAERRLGGASSAAVNKIPLDDTLVDGTLHPGSVSPPPPSPVASTTDAPATDPPATDPPATDALGDPVLTGGGGDVAGTDDTTAAAPAPATPPDDPLGTASFAAATAPDQTPGTDILVDTTDSFDTATATTADTPTEVTDVAGDPSTGVAMGDGPTDAGGVDASFAGGGDDLAPTTDDPDAT
jgi:hypothetical protein